MPPLAPPNAAFLGEALLDALGVDWGAGADDNQGEDLWLDEAVADPPAPSAFPSQLLSQSMTRPARTAPER